MERNMETTGVIGCIYIYRGYIGIIGCECV